MLKKHNVEHPLINWQLVENDSSLKLYMNSSAEETDFGVLGIYHFMYLSSKCDSTFDIYVQEINNG